MSTLRLSLDGLAGRLSGRVAGWRHRFAANGQPADPAEALFRRVRWRLAARYTAALAAMLLIAGMLLYFGMRQALLGPVTDNLQSSAAQISSTWRTNPPFDPGAVCIVPRTVVRVVPYVECSGPQGTGTLQGNNPPPPAFSEPSLMQAALKSTSGSATDTVQSDNGLGAIRRYALVVHANHGGILGVVQVGIPIQGELTALHVLLLLLLALGAIALAGAVVGGVLLSSPALAPARLALERQQAFIGDAAHEMRTPLTLLRANAELLLHDRSRLDPEDVPLLEDIVAEAAHMSALATSMLELARLDAGTRPPEREVVDLAALATDLTRRAESLAAAHETALRVVADVPVLVLGDRTQLEEVALILLDNAIKYNHPGGSVSLSVAHDGATARLIVRDTGSGIAEEHLKRLGERFYRVEKSRSRELGGAGLGLSIARRIVAAHGGALAFASVVGQGTTVTLTLPAVSGAIRGDQS
ncbi:MAG: sensor histidine kinase [Ktedonobacterales bacterium]